MASGVFGDRPGRSRGCASSRTSGCYWLVRLRCGKGWCVYPGPSQVDAVFFLMQGFHPCLGRSFSRPVRTVLRARKKRRPANRTFGDARLLNVLHGLRRPDGKDRFGRGALWKMAVWPGQNDFPDISKPTQVRSASSCERNCQWFRDGGAQPQRSTRSIMYRFDSPHAASPVAATGLLLRRAAIRAHLVRNRRAKYCQPFLLERTVQRVVDGGSVPGTGCPGAFARPDGTGALAGPLGHQGHLHGGDDLR